MTLRETLISLVTQYDKKQSTKKFYNPYALAQYLEAVDRVVADFEKGMGLNEALTKNFNDRLLEFLVKKVIA
jgi:hypothetical protein